MRMLTLRCPDSHATGFSANEDVLCVISGKQTTRLISAWVPSGPKVLLSWSGDGVGGLQNWVCEEGLEGALPPYQGASG